MKKIVILLLFVPFLFVQLYSQQDKCSDILKQNVRDTYKIKTSFHSDISKAIDISKMSYSEFKSKWKGGVSIPYYAVTYKANINEDKFNQKKKILTQRLREHRVIGHEKEIFILAANKDIINSWRGCMKSNSYPGKFEAVVTPVDVRNGKYDYSYHYTSFPDAKPIFLGYSNDDNLKVIDNIGYLEKGKAIRPNAKAIVKLELKNPYKSATLTVHTSLGDKTFFIPSYTNFYTTTYENWTKAKPNRIHKIEMTFSEAKKEPISLKYLHHSFIDDIDDIEINNFKCSSDKMTISFEFKILENNEVYSVKISTYDDWKSFEGTAISNNPKRPKDIIFGKS